MDKKTEHQLTLISQITKALEKQQIPYWLIGGFAVDAVLGKVTREHHDIDVLILHSDRDKVAELVTTINTYDFLVITQWSNYKFVGYDPDKKINADFGFISFKDNSVEFLRNGNKFYLPKFLFPKENKFRLEKIDINVVEPTLLYASKLHMKRLDSEPVNKEKDKNDLELLKPHANQKLLKQIEPEVIKFEEAIARSLTP